jgi:hypothetical protein
MPPRHIAAILSVIKIVNAVRMGTLMERYPLATDDLNRRFYLGNIFKQLIAGDVEDYWPIRCRPFKELREIKRKCFLAIPHDGNGNALLASEIRQGENVFTLTPSDFGRGGTVFDVAKLFGMNDPAEPSDANWYKVVQSVLGVWGEAEAVAMDVVRLSQCTLCTEASLQKLKNWICIRATGKDVWGQEATDADKAWASDDFPLTSIEVRMDSKNS